MGRHTALCLLLVALATSYSVSAEDKPCSAATFVRLEECCAMPVLSDKKDFDECTSNVPGAEERTKDGGLNVYKSFGGVRGGPGGPSCLMKCLLEREGLLDKDGELDEKNALAKFLQSAKEPWKPLVKDAFAKCSADVAATIKNNQANDQGCKPKPALIITCVRRELALKCPKEFINTQDDKCPSKFEKLNDCNPLTMKNDEWPMLRAHKMRVGRRKGGKGGAKKQGRKGGEKGKKGRKGGNKAKGARKGKDDKNKEAEKDGKDKKDNKDKNAEKKAEKKKEKGKN